MGKLVHKTIDGIRLIGYSVAGEESVVAAPEYNVCFDVGRAPREIIPIDNVCLTHGHMDHAAGIAYYFSQRDFIGNAPGRVIVHRSLAQSIQKLMDIWADIEGHHASGQVYGVEHLEDVPIRRGLIVRAFTVNHGRGALGFSLLEVRHKLRDEFVGKSGPQLVELKRQGVEIERHMELALLSYTGDTAAGAFLDLPFVRESRVLILECTFFDPAHRIRARSGRHIHVDDLPGILEAVPEAQVLLTHLTRRTDLRQAKRLIERTVSRSQLDRLHLLMDRPPRASLPHATPVASPAERPASPQARATGR